MEKKMLKNMILNNLTILEEHRYNVLLEEYIKEGAIDPGIVNFIKQNYTKLKTLLKRDDTKNFLKTITDVDLPDVSTGSIHSIGRKIVDNYDDKLKENEKLIDENFKKVDSKYKEAIASILTIIPKEKIQTVIEKTKNELSAKKISLTAVLWSLLVFIFMCISIYKTIFLITVGAPISSIILSLMLLILWVRAFISNIKMIIEKPLEPIFD
jgi:hypothetical protein